MRLLREMSQISGWLRTAKTNNIGYVELCRRIINQLRFKSSLWVLARLSVKARPIEGQAEGQAISNILICNLDNLGDAIRITPAIRAIKQKWPHSSITSLVSDYNQPIFQNNPHIASLVILPRNPGPLKTLKLISRLKKKKFSHSFIFCFGPGVADYCAMLSVLANIPIRVGIDNVSKTGLLTYRHMRTSEDTHVELLKNTIQAIGIELCGSLKEVCVTKKEEDWAKNIMDLHFKEQPGSPVIVVAPGGFGHVGYTVSRVWPDKCFRQLLIRIIEVYPRVRIIITGNERDCKIADMICKDLDEANVINMTNKLSVRQLGSLLKVADAVVTNDNGTLHLADAVSARHVICVAGPTDPRLMLESGNTNVQVVRKLLSCGPCITVSAFLECTLPEGQICLTRMDVEDVFSVLQKTCPN